MAVLNSGALIQILIKNSQNNKNLQENFYPLGTFFQKFL